MQYISFVARKRMIVSVVAERNGNQHCDFNCDGFIYIKFKIVMQSPTRAPLVLHEKASATVPVPVCMRSSLNER